MNRGIAQNYKKIDQDPPQEQELPQQKTDLRPWKQWKQDETPYLSKTPIKKTTLIKKKPTKIKTWLSKRKSMKYKIIQSYSGIAEELWGTSTTFDQPQPQNSLPPRNLPKRI